MKNTFTSESNLLTMSEANLVSIENLTDLKIKTENAVLEYLKDRFYSQNIYTWAGQTLLAVNPFHKVIDAQQNELETPHVYTIVNRAWFRFTNQLGKKNQVLVISGETGSGKTYSTCAAIKYIITNKINSYDDSIQGNLLQQILASVPLMTAFGNAATIHNKNSSRFGKLLQLQYKNNTIVGGYIQTYMLEKSRVSKTNIDESNFHIFQLMLENIDETVLQIFYLSKHTPYKIVSKLTHCPVNHDDFFNSLEYLKINKNIEIFTILSAILNLGNIHFAINNETYCVSPETAIYSKYVANLLQTDANRLNNFMTTRIISAGAKDKKRNSCYFSPCLSKQECESRRNCLMKFLYEKLFLWLVNCINRKISKMEETSLFGLLDIYGFEVFDNNTFEQMCINYANEKLQHFFINDYLIERQKTYEDNVYVEIFENNEYIARMMLLEGHFPSLFSILDEESIIKRYNNDFFVNARLTEHLKHYPHFIAASNNFSTYFSIKHFAGTVKYNSSNMVAKNVDREPEEMLEFLNNCKLEFLKEILPEDEETCKSKQKTLLSKFKKSLDDLMSTLNSADVHYIKCLKPNDSQVPKKVDEEFFARQLKMYGIFEILKLYRQKCSIKITLEKFNEMFIQAIVPALKDEMQEEMYIGKKHVYLTERSYHIFQSVHKIRFGRAVIMLQRRWRTIYSLRNNAAVVIQKYFKNMSRKSYNHSQGEFSSSSGVVIDISKISDSSSNSQNTSCTTDSLEDLSEISSQIKTLEYIRNLTAVQPSEGDPVSVSLEKVCDSLKTKSFTRTYFRDDHIVSHLRILEVPIRMHLSKTCIPFSHLLPISERCSGLSDIF